MNNYVNTAMRSHNKQNQVKIWPEKYFSQDLLTHCALVTPYGDTKRNQHWLRKWLGHDDVIKWKTFPRYWPFVRGIHRSPVTSPHKAQWRGAFIFSLIYARINGWVNNREAGDLRRYRAHYDVIVMVPLYLNQWWLTVSKEPWHSSESIIIRRSYDTNQY